MAMQDSLCICSPRTETRVRGLLTVGRSDCEVCGCQAPSVLIGINSMSLTIWTNSIFSETATEILRAGTRAHRLITSTQASASVLAVGASDESLREADVALGQPNPEDCLHHGRLKWVEVTSAGYTRFDTPRFFEGFSARGGRFTNASGVFADPCAQHVLAMMLALGRQLLPSYRDQLTDHSWHYEQRRYDSRLLTGQTVVLLGYGAIGRRLVDLLRPFGMTVYAVRRSGRSEEGVLVVEEARLPEVLPLADHVVNILPANGATGGFMNAARFGMCKRTARFYNVGRGSTVDEAALLEALNSGRIASAYLDVMEVEPLPVENPLWSAPGCFVTPHTAGGRHDQDEALVRHFLENLAAFEAGHPMKDLVF